LPVATARVVRALRDGIRRHGDRILGGPLLVAVSGGPDSTALLLGLMSLPEKVRIPLQVAHFSHGLRPEAEAPEAVQVAELSARWGLPLLHGRGDVATHAKQAKLSLEAAARELRYTFLFESAVKCGATAIVLGHTLDDQVETVLLRMVRGSGLRGVAAMKDWSIRESQASAAGVALWRPMLEVPREDTEAVCVEHGVTPVRDASNSSLDFARNRVRLRVVPELEAINPRLRQTLTRLALSAREDDALLESLANAAVQGTEEWGASSVTWPRDVLAGLPGPLLVRVLQRAWRRVRGEGSALSQRNITAIGSLLQGSPSSRASLPGGMEFAVEADRCHMGAPLLELPGLGEATLLAVPGTTHVGPWRVEATELGVDGIQDFGPWVALLDADAIGNGLSLRGRRHGDRFHPLGMEQPKRLQDFFVDVKVPVRERAATPLLVTSKGIAWVGGQRVAQWAAIQNSTSRVLRVSVQRWQENG
jgi:tRNA(Ile)-lysidine synthase